MRRQNLLIGNDYIVFKVIFYPGALFHFIRTPLSEVTDGTVDAEAVFSKEIRPVNDRLNSMEDLNTMVDVVETFLVRMVNKMSVSPEPIEHISKLLLHGPDVFSLDRLARESCLSIRQFQRKFHERVGVAPKMFARISRFDKAFRLKYYNPHFDWLRVAVDCGYHDYQHLSKDFMEFAHVLPNTLIQEESHSPDCYFGFKE